MICKLALSCLTEQPYENRAAVLLGEEYRSRLVRKTLVLQDHANSVGGDAFLGTGKA